MRADKTTRYPALWENIWRPSTGNFEMNESHRQSYRVMRSTDIFVLWSVCATIPIGLSTRELLSNYVDARCFRPSWYGLSISPFEMDDTIIFTVDVCSCIVHTIFCVLIDRYTATTIIVYSVYANRRYDMKICNERIPTFIIAVLRWFSIFRPRMLPLFSARLGYNDFPWIARRVRVVRNEHVPRCRSERTETRPGRVAARIMIDGSFRAKICRSSWNYRTSSAYSSDR